MIEAEMKVRVMHLVRLQGMIERYIETEIESTFRERPHKPEDIENSIMYIVNSQMTHLNRIGE